MRRQALPLEFRPHDLLTDESARRSALWRAAARDDVATIETLLDDDRVNAADDFGRTALHHAADAGAVDAMAVLLARGASIEAADHYGVTPLMLACGAERPEACTELLRARASVTAADRAGNTALVYALRRSRTQQAQALLAAGAAPVHVSVAATSAAAADPSARAATDAYQGWPDIAVAASRKDSTMLRDLLRRGADPNATTPGGETALLVAVAADAAQSVALLLQAGADASRANRSGASPLIVAVRLGREAALEALLANGVDPNARSKQEPPALLVAVETGNARVVQQLLAAGAEADARGAGNVPPLIAAAGRNQASIVDLLIAAGATPSPGDGAGRSALWLGLVQRRLCGRRLAAESRCHRRRGRSRGRDTARLRCGARSCGRRRSPRALRCESRGPHGQR